MTPAARLSAAIEVLDRFLAGEAAEKALTSWARGARYAGSKDRAAVRDLVFDALRCLRSHAALGGAMTGRGLILGGLRARGEAEDAHFTGEGHAPQSLTPAERMAGALAEGYAALDCPDWLGPALAESLGEKFAPVMEAMRHRAPVFLRVNLLKTSREAAIAKLDGEGIAARPHPLSPTALEVTEGARQVQSSTAYGKGLVELQDAASQAVVDLLPLADGMKVLDYCAGGGGKVLAMAGRASASFFAHDAAADRMRDLPARAARAGVALSLLSDPSREAPYDLVLCDAPCSGSGAWRRSPEGKWRLTEGRLASLLEIQDKILSHAASLVGPQGHLAYATCSLLAAENEVRIASFLSRTSGWKILRQTSLTPIDGGDGFHVSVLTRGPGPESTQPKVVAD